MYSCGGPSSGDKNLVPEGAGCLPEETLLIYDINSPYYDVVQIQEISTSENTSHVPLPMPICHPSVTQAVVADDNTNENEVVSLTGVVKDNDRNNFVGNAGGNSSPETQSVDPVMFSDGSSLKRGRGRPRKCTLNKDSVVPMSSQSQSGHLPVVNQGSNLVTRRREMPPRSCKKTKAPEIDLHSPDISYSSEEQEAGATIPSAHSHDISISGSGKQQKASATIYYPPSPHTSAGSAGSGFSVHTITVRTNEDIFRKVLSFSRQAICILSASGAISNVALHHPSSGRTVIYEGCFKILSLSGCVLSTESAGGIHISTGGLSVLLAGPDGRLLGGSVSGLFTAASSVQDYANE